ncbi:MAG: gas vesicle protein GvpG [Chloroflexota bacterium]|nr:gas vesicle protein GvpG [Chloroflexota bacterium]MDE3192667.1 gas vesicle protein GvpG [Chloroflexota bacterium]
MLLKLLTLPVSLPASGIRFCLDKVIEMAEAEANSEEPIKEELLEMQIALEEGRMDERAYTARETVLLARLREIRERHRALAREQVEERVVEEGQGSRVVIEIPEELR